MTVVSTQDQLAASRMLCAKLHVALTRARSGLVSEQDDNTIVNEVDEALEYNEPEILALLADAERELKVERLVKSVEVVMGEFMEKTVNVQALSDAMDELAKALAELEA